MTAERTANVRTPRQRCHDTCSRTFRHEHGASVPGGPFPGTLADPGDVRRCEHGRLWTFDPYTSRGDYRIDHWRRLYPLEPAWWRARRRLHDRFT